MFGNIVTENVIPARAADTPDLAQGTNGNAVGVSDTIITTGFIKNTMSSPRTVICLLRNDLRLIDNEVRPSVSQTKELVRVHVFIKRYSTGTQIKRTRSVKSAR